MSESACVWSGATYERIAETFAPIHDRVVAALALWQVEGESGESLWELVSTSTPPLRAWLAEQPADVRARAELVYRDFLSSGQLRREYVLVLGRRR